MRRILVVANQTLAGQHLAHEIRDRMAAGPCAFHLVVPATPPGRLATWTEGETLGIAGHRLHEALTRLKELGAEATGEVGDPNPMDAIDDAMRDGSFDEIILSTLPAGISRWLKQDLPHRVQHRYAVPVTHVVGTD